MTASHLTTALPAFLFAFLMLSFFAFMDGRLRWYHFVFAGFQFCFAGLFILKETQMTGAFPSVAGLLWYLLPPLPGILLGWAAGIWFHRLVAPEVRKFKKDHAELCQKLDDYMDYVHEFWRDGNRKK